MEYNKEELLKLYNSCKKMIYNIAFKYSNSKYDNEDLMQQAYLIMVDTLKTFDKNRGVKFTTYFYKILDMKLYDYANSKCSYIRVPTYFYNRKKIIKDYIKKYKKIYGIYPSIREISRYLNVGENTLLCYMNLLKKPLSIEELREKEDNNILIDEELREKEDNNILIDEERGLNYINTKLQQEYLYNYIMNLNITDKSKEAIVIRYGLLDGNYKTLLETSNILNCTQSEVSRLIKYGFNSLRRNPKILKLLK